MRKSPSAFFSAPILFFLFSEKEKNRRSVRRSLLHSASAGAAKAPYSQPPSSFPKADRCAGSPFGSNKKRKETTGEPFEWFPGSSIDQSLALDLRRMEVGKSTIEYVGGDEGIGPYKVQRKIEGCGRTESSTPTNAAKDVWEIHCGGE